jgi:heme exporter protein D
MVNSVVKRGGLYKSQKRKKEILRQKKQEEKRKRRLNKHADTQQDTEEMAESREEEPS